jgi:hypothetical protein
MAAARLPLHVLQHLWRGEFPLHLAFWRYLVTYGLVLNLGSTIAALAVVLAEGPIALAVVLHLLPLPYAVVATVGTWRSAHCFQGNRNLANGAKFFAVFWTVLMLFI